MTPQRLRITICLAMICSALHGRAQATDCNILEASAEANALAQQIWESRSSPVYDDAVALARDLETRGIKVQCIRRSKEENLFTNQKGAAWFKTSEGIFEVWFMRDARAAARAVAKVTKRPLPTNLPSGRVEFFIQHQNMVFHVSLGDRTMAATIQKAYPAPSGV